MPVFGTFLARLMIIIFSVFKLFGDNQVPSFLNLEPRKMNYPYFYLWFGGLPPPIFNGRMKNYKPSGPTVYLYGKNKPF